ncbi:MAG: 3-phosphoshikimate 1-carboxyvinyltransferase [Acidimicrobiales bacterium]
MSDPLLIEPLAQPPDADVVVPGSKSHTNRALLCAALADGVSHLHRPLDADDTRAMIDALRTLGVTFERGADADDEILTVAGTGGTLASGPLTVDVAQSGTTSRFLLAALALGDGPYLLDGHPQLRARPFGPLIDALRRLGATVDGDALPLTVAGRLHTGSTTVSGTVSSQFLSGLLLAAPLAEVRPGGPLAVTVEVAGGLVSAPYVELTLSTMAAFGVEVDAAPDLGSFVVEPQAYRARPLTIEPDASAASYFFAAAAITGGRVRVDGLGRHTVQGDLAFVDALEAMGATVERGETWTEVRGPDRLRGIDIDMAHMSDVAQTLAAVATFADGPTRVRGVGFIRHKETDRIGAVVTELQRLGLDAVDEPDGFVVHPGRPRPAIVTTYGDHRMAMSFALLGLVHPGIAIADPGCVAKTFPHYFQVLDGLRR